MSEVALYAPSAVQQEAHFCPAREILYGGTQGCGKTWFLRWDPIITQVYDWRGSPGEHTRYLEALKRGESYESKGWALHLRRTFPEIEQTIQKTLGFIRKFDSGADWIAKSYIIKLTCGYRIQFGHCKEDDSWRAYDTSEYSHIAFDELIHFTKEQYDGIRRRLRCEDALLNAKRRLVSASNPDAPAEGLWVKERFVDPAPDGRTLMRTNIEMSDGTKEEYLAMFIPASLSDNPDPEFRRQTEIDLRTQPIHIQQARLMGRWDVVEGAFFSHLWIPSVHVVKPSRCEHRLTTCQECHITDGVPNHYPRGRAMDWGFKKACPVMWYAKNPDGDLIIYREVTFNFKVPEAKRKDAQMVALAIKRIEQEHGEWDERRKCSKLSGPADYQICVRDGGTGPTIEETMAKEGVYWEKSIKGRFAGTSELIRRLCDVPTRPGAHPALMVFDTCKELQRIMPLIAIDPNNPELPKKDDNGHWLETLLYICMSCLPNADKKCVRSPDDEDDRDELTVARRRKNGYGQ